MSKVLVITDMDSVGSGYKYICAPLFTQLAGYGYDIKVIGLQYTGDDHEYPFSLIPSASVQDSHAIASNIMQLWLPDVVIVAMDLIHQESFYITVSKYFNRPGLPKTKYIAISPMENGPLKLSWAAPLYNMDGVFFISELGKQEALKVGIKAEHLVVGVDPVSFRPPLPDEKFQLRKGLGISEDTFVVLTVADNQERKNLWAGMDTISKLKSLTTRPIKYILVTREKNAFGWDLRGLSTSLQINNELLLYERGMSRKDLWALYAIADAYLQPSKAEGLGLPILDAMLTKVPVVATDTGAMTELLSDGRGYLVQPEYEFIDVWGNSKRSMMSRDDASRKLSDLCGKISDVTNAYLYVCGRTWEYATEQLHNKITELLDEKK